MIGYQTVFSWSRCVYDVDNRYVDVMLMESDGSPGAFVLQMSDTSNDPELDTEIDVHMSLPELKHIVEHLTKVVENAELLQQQKEKS
jgi:hypothetical protein